VSQWQRRRSETQNNEVTMAPLLVLVAATVLARLLGYTGVRALSDWRAAARWGLAVMFLFTGSTHFAGMKYDYAAMVPPPFTGQLWVIYLTGLLEIAWAVGLLMRPTQRLAGLCLLLLLLALFPANAYAAMQGVQFRGAPPTDIWLRSSIQAVFLVTVWWSTIARVGRLREAAQPAAGADR
jgi:uncharacterized membrane protein